jgi:hypothetical protein
MIAYVSMLLPVAMGLLGVIVGLRELRNVRKLASSPATASGETVEVVEVSFPQVGKTAPRPRTKNIHGYYYGNIPITGKIAAKMLSVRRFGKPASLPTLEPKVRVRK